jgi:hypothetical protein
MISRIIRVAPAAVDASPLLIATVCWSICRILGQEEERTAYVVFKGVGYSETGHKGCS